MSQRTWLPVCAVLAALAAAGAVCPPSWGQESETTEDPYFRLYFPDGVVAEGPTRHPKSLSQTAENVTIVTAAEIRDLNAHTLAEVLYRVNGVFIDRLGGNVGSLSLNQIQGSREEQVLVLVDGMPWNFLGGGNAETVTIPVGAIDRIEVIKGPASSAWGSSLGGVVNVLLKGPAKGATPTGSASASYGERDTWDGRAEVAGTAGKVGYYAYGGAQRADWQNGGDFKSGAGYAKTALPLTRGVTLGFSGGLSRVHSDPGRLPSQGVFIDDRLESLFATASLEADLPRDTGFYASVYGLRQKLDGTGTEDGTLGPPGALARETQYEDKSWGLRSRFVWHPENHAMVLGLDADRGELDQTVTSGALFQSHGAPARFETSPNLTRGGLYANDTWCLGPWTLTPGVRFDWSSETGSFTSPSLGVTRALGSDSVLRALVARGFSSPPLAEVSGGGVSLDPNPDLEPEKVWSYQLGLETKAVPYLWAKLTAFRHDVTDLRVLVESPVAHDGVKYGMYVNRGSGRRTGIEAEAETAPVFRTALRAAFAYVHVDQPGNLRTRDQYTADLALRYRDGDSLHAELAGHFVWWDLGAGQHEGRRDDALWDLNVWKRLSLWKGLATELFLTVHNLFNGRQYVGVDRPNPDRWVEGGVRLRY